MKITTSTVTTSLLISITRLHVKVVVDFYIGVWESTAGWIRVGKRMEGTAFLVLFSRSIDVRKGKRALVETAFTNFKKM